MFNWCCDSDVTTNPSTGSALGKFSLEILLHIVYHYDDVIMTTLASQITSLTVVYSIVYSAVDQRKHQSSASLAFVRGIHRRPVNSPHKGPVTRKMFPFDDVIMIPQIMHLARLYFIVIVYRLWRFTWHIFMVASVSAGTRYLQILRNVFLLHLSKVPHWIFS